jgi:hypothetical protein
MDIWYLHQVVLQGCLEGLHCGLVFDVRYYNNYTFFPFQRAICDLIEKLVIYQVVRYNHRLFKQQFELEKYFCSLDNNVLLNFVDLEL